MTKLVPLTQGQHALVDDEDYERVMQYKWSAHRYARGVYYAKRQHTETRKHQTMASFVLNLPRGTMVDHINRNTLDNRRSNLRPADHSINSQNQNKRRGNYASQQVGVTFDSYGRWRATITRNGRTRYRVRKTEAQAIMLRQSWERQLANGVKFFDLTDDA